MSLSNNRFSEKVNGRILPDWEEFNLGSHTRNSDGHITVFDGHYRRIKGPRMYSQALLRKLVAV